MRVFVTGATGLIGSRLLAALAAQGSEVVALSRREPACLEQPSVRWIRGDPGRHGRWMDAIDGCDAVVHLAGEPLTRRRWSVAQKRRLVASRVDSTHCIVHAISLSRSRPSVLVCASATGFYGPRGDARLDEDSSPGNDFLAKLCVDWENAAGRAESWDLRVVTARFGVVLSSCGGALPALAGPFRWRVGGSIGPPKRWFPWVHEEDATGLLLHALEQPVVAALNVVSPGVVQMGDFARGLGRALGRRALVRTPLPLLRLAIGELADHLCPGQQVHPTRAIESGYRFRHPKLDEALSSCL